MPDLCAQLFLLQIMYYASMVVQSTTTEGSLLAAILEMAGGEEVEPAMGFYNKGTQPYDWID